MKKFWIIILFSLSFSAISAQTQASADALFQAADYATAQEQYAKLIKRYPKHALYLYRYARCAQELGDYATALSYFEQSGNRYDLKHYHVGEIYMKLWQPEQAIAAYEQYLACANIAEERRMRVQDQIAYAEKLQRYMRRVEQLQILDTMEVHKDSLAAILSLSSEAGQLRFNAQGEFVYTNQRDDRRLWADSAHQIVSSIRLLDQWTEPTALPQDVNFSTAQANPYVLSDGVTLYFAACDSNGLGGYDIYITRYNTTTESYTTPENIGLPYNSPANDYFLIVDENQQVAYLASDRHAKAEHVRIYRFVPSLEKRYWRNISADSLSAYAQLKWYVQATPQEDTIIIEDTNQDVETSIFFVLNDSVVYTRLEEFKSHDAKKKFQEWEKLHKQLEADCIHLQDLRFQYNEAQEHKQKKLAPTILQLENKQSQKNIECNQLLYEIQKLELMHFKHFD